MDVRKLFDSKNALTTIVVGSNVVAAAVVILIFFFFQFVRHSGIF